jgi:hypothetical protein
VAKLIGGSDLRARLTSLADVPPEFASDWAKDAAKRMEQTAPNAQRPESRRFTTKVSRTRAGVYGAFWWIFVDRGTKAHDIFARRGEALRFEWKDQTIFARKVHLPRKARRPFITNAAKEALAGSAWIDTVVKSWNKRRLSSHQRFL